MTILKKTLTLATAVGLLLAASSANAANPLLKKVAYYPNTYTCYAESPSAWGLSTNYVLRYAQINALNLCAANTPTYQTCIVRRCVYNP